MATEVSDFEIEIHQPTKTLGTECLIDRALRANGITKRATTSGNQTVMPVAIEAEC